MEPTENFVKKLQDNKKKQEDNKRSRGENTPSQKLPNKQHS